MVLKELHFVIVVENPTRTLMVEKTDIFRHPH
jgi:hypothetical protein